MNFIYTMAAVLDLVSKPGPTNLKTEDCLLFWLMSNIRLKNLNLQKPEADCMYIVQHEGNNSSEQIIQ